MIRILILGEGPTDCGKKDYMSEELLDGPVEVYIRKILNGQGEVVFSFPKDEDKKSRPRFQQIGKGLDRHGIKAAILMRMAMRDKYQCVAYYSDADREQGSDARDKAQCRKRYKKLKDDIIKGFEKGQRNTENAIQVSSIAIIPVKMIESWLMGDPNAFSLAFPNGQKKGKHQENCPNQPELDWGDYNDPKSNHPKHRLERILAGYGQASNQMTFCKIAECADVETLRTTCPISFADFYEQVKKIVIDSSSDK